MEPRRYTNKNGKGWMAWDKGRVLKSVLSVYDDHIYNSRLTKILLWDGTK